MFIEKEYLDAWLDKIMERFDSLENKISKPPEKERQRLDGELLLDNQDICFMLNICKRTLQRYRTLGWLPFSRIDQKAYYRESDVKTFIEERAKKKRRPPPA
jgi:hypothetical protein